MKKAVLVTLFALAGACSPDQGTTVKPGETKATAPAGADAGVTSTSVPADAPGGPGATTAPGQSGIPTGGQATTTTAGAGGQVTTTTAGPGGPGNTPTTVDHYSTVKTWMGATTTTGPPYTGPPGCREVEGGGYQCGTFGTPPTR